MKRVHPDDYKEDLVLATLRRLSRRLSVRFGRWLGRLRGRFGR